MMSSLTIPHTPETKARELASLAYAANTSAAYRADLDHFEAWCEAHNLPSLPATPRTVAEYLADHEETLSVATLARRMAAIARSHEWLGFPSPSSARHHVVGVVWRGIKRKNGTAARHAKKPLLTEQILAMLATCSGPTKVRDTAILLLGFAGAFRRSEIMQLDLADLQFSRAGLRVELRRSKTDQEGAGRLVGIPRGQEPATCPVAAVKAWLEVRGDAPGPLFPSTRAAGGRLTNQMVRLIVVKACKAAGITASDYSAHSLRSGMVTQAIRGGASDHAIMDQTGHRSPEMVRRYRRETDLFRDNAASRLGL